MDCSRKAASASSLEELHEDAMGSCRDFYTNIAEPEGRSHHKNTPVIITLCMTGEGGAVQMKNYLEKNAGLNGIHVDALKLEKRLRPSCATCVKDCRAVSRFFCPSASVLGPNLRSFSVKRT